MPFGCIFYIHMQEKYVIIIYTKFEAYSFTQSKIRKGVPSCHDDAPLCGSFLICTCFEVKVKRQRGQYFRKTIVVMLIPLSVAVSQ